MAMGVGFFLSTRVLFYPLGSTWVQVLFQTGASPQRGMGEEGGNQLTPLLYQVLLLQAYNNVDLIQRTWDKHF